VGRPGDRQPSGRRVIAIDRDKGEIVWTSRSRARPEFGRVEKFLTAPLVADGKVIVQNGAATAERAGLGSGARGENRQGAMALVRRAQAGRTREAKPGKTDTTPGKPRGGIWQTGYDPATRLYIVGTGNPSRSTIRGTAGRQSL